MVYKEIPTSVATFMETITDLCGETHADWAKNFNAAFANTLLTTVKRHEDGTTFLLTGIFQRCGCEIPLRKFVPI